jgi:hypothetical protein
MFEELKNLFGPKTNPKDVEVQLAIDQALLLNQDLVYNKYPQIDRMYEDKMGLGQWNEPIPGTAVDRLDGYSKLVHNFIADVIDRWTMFIGSNPPTFTVQNASEWMIGSDVTPVEREVNVDEDEADAIKKIIMRCQRQKHSNFRSLFLRLAHTQSRYGRAMLYTHKIEGMHYPIIELLRPHDSFPVYDSLDYQRVLYFVNRKLIDRKLLAAQLGVDEKTLPIERDPLDTRTGGITDRERTFQYRLLTPTELITFVGGRVTDIQKNEYGMVPIFTAQNRITPFDASGKDDVSSSFKDQKAYNMSYSDLIDVASDYAIGKRLIKKPGQTTDLNMLYDRLQRHVIIGPETEVTDLHPTVKLSEIKVAMGEAKANIEDDTGITELLKGRFSGSIATGVALSGLSRGIEDMAREKIVNISEALENAFNHQLYILKNFGGNDPDSGKPYSEIIKRDWYNFDFVWDNMSIQDERVKASTQLDLSNAGIISKLTAAKNLRVQYPDDEQARVMFETMNPMLNPKLAMELASKEIQDTGFSPEQELLDAKHENAQLIHGEMPMVDETKPGQHAIHLAEHEKIRKMARGKVKENLDKHIKMHNQGMQTEAPAPSAPGAPAPAQGGAAPAPAGGEPTEMPRPAAQAGVPNPQSLA